LFISLLLLLIQPAIAEDSFQDLDFVNIAEGEAAPFSGKLLTNEAIAEILSKHQLEIDNLKIQHTAELEKQSLDLKLRYDMLDARFKLDTELYKGMIDNRDLLLKDFNPNQNSGLTDWKFTGGFLAGAAVTIGIAYSLDKLVY
jgi:hypothetical protein